MPVVSTAEKIVKIHFTEAKALLLSLSVHLNNIAASPPGFQYEQDFYYSESKRPYLYSNCRVDTWQTVAEN